MAQRITEQEVFNSSDQLSQIMQQISDLEQAHDALMNVTKPLAEMTATCTSIRNSHSKSPALSMKRKQDTFREMKKQKAVT